ncbi:MAG: right-handed parallel beta-helix repeat-containing protein [Nitrososphaeraceae archaeon]
MDKPKKCRNQNSLANTFAISVTITLLMFGALTIDPLLVLATGEVGDEGENPNVDGSINNGNGPLSSSPLPSPPSQQGMNTDIIDSSTSGAADLSIQSSLQEQQLGSLIEGTTTNAACGQVASGVVNLTANLNCSGDGIIISGPNTVVNMNGFSITGPGKDSSKVGIMVSNADNVVVNGPGTISNFQAAVLLSGSNGFKLDSTILENNQIAMFMTGADNAEVQQNMIKDNNIGIASHSNSGSKISSNLMSANQLAGITFVNTRSSSMDMNNIHGSQDGVFLDEQSSDNTINANNVLQNAVDINNANGLPLNINSNQYTENNCGISNPSGLCIGG